jgi:hypothetical protein
MPFMGWSGNTVTLHGEKLPSVQICRLRQPAELSADTTPAEPPAPVADPPPAEPCEKRKATEADYYAVLKEHWGDRPKEAPNLPLTEIKKSWRKWLDDAGLRGTRKALIACFDAHPEMHGEPGKRNRPR